jgi:hypothetical protein
MNDVAGSGWIKSVSADDTANVSLDSTNVTSEVDTMVKATAASADYMMPLVHKAGSDPDKKITLGNIFKFVLNFIHSLTDTATEADLVAGNYFALDGSAGTKKLNSTTLLTKTAQNSLGSIHSLSGTATDFASDDYIAIDGSTNGSRKMPKGDLLNVSAIFSKSMKNSAAGSLIGNFGSGSGGGGIVIAYRRTGYGTGLVLIDKTTSSKVLHIGYGSDNCPLEVLTDGTRVVVKNKAGIALDYNLSVTTTNFVVSSSYPDNWDSGSVSTLQVTEFTPDTIEKAKRWTSLSGNAYFGNFPTAGGGGIVIAYRRAGYASGMVFIGKYSSNSSFIHISDGSACPLEVLFDGTRMVVKSKVPTSMDVNLVVTTTNFVTSSSLPAGWDAGSAVALTPSEIKPVVNVNFDETLDYSLLNAAARINYSSNGSKDFCSLIVTDSHADDSSVTRAVSYTGKSSAVSCLIHGGDYVANTISYGQASTNWAAAVAASSKPTFFVQGNHEKGTYFSIQRTPSDTTLYDLFVKPIVDKGYLSVGEYEQNKCYYFHDFSALKTRLIVLDEYRAPTDYLETYWQAITYDATLSDVADNTDYAIGDKVNVPGFTANSFQAVQAVNTGAYYSGKQPCYKCRRGYRYIDQTEAQWFLDTLYSTPSDYVVVVAMHNPFSDLALPDKTKKFCQQVNIGESVTGADWAQNYMATDFVADALNAFKTGASYSATISTKSNSEAAYISDYSVAKDFSARGEGKLGLIIGGHVHRDVVWKHPTYTYMYQVTPMCSITTSRDNNYSADIRLQNDNSFDKYIDSLTAFAVADGRAALAKLGCKFTTDARVRDIEVI